MSEGSLIRGRLLKGAPNQKGFDVALGWLQKSRPKKAAKKSGVKTALKVSYPVVTPKQ